MSVYDSVGIWFKKKIGAKCEIIDAVVFESRWLDEAEFPFLVDLLLTTPRQQYEFAFKNMSVIRKICCVNQPVFKLQFHPEAVEIELKLQKSHRV